MTLGRCAIASQQRQPRNPRIEALRLVAIAAIALFHTFQPWFTAATDAASNWALAYPWICSTPIRALLGCINLLGAYGNHVFFLISGYFMLPRAIEAAGSPAFVKDQARKTLRRVAIILCSAVFYALVTLLLDALVVPVEGVSLDETEWLLSGLEFIWVYLALIVLTPVMAKIAKRLSSWRHLVVALGCAVFALNAYIAFLSPGEAQRDLLEWRKLMSAASYLVAYLTGACVAKRRAYEASGSSSLIAALSISILAECLMAASGHPELLAASSYKSTSALSFALAIASLEYAVDATSSSKASPRLLGFANGILGFYIVQSMTAGLWRPLFEELTFAAAASGAGALIIAGVVLSMLILVAVLLIDRVTRQQLLKALRLS